jgi:eukaryotic-like serine/threonine-protein kinase
VSSGVSDSRLYRLLRGELSTAEQAELELAIETDSALRDRLERLSHSSEWPVGSAPVPTKLTSEHLSGVMASLLTSVGDDSQLSSSPTESIEVPEIQKLSGLSGIRIVRELGRGGMGVVYEGIDDLLNRRVAVKQLFPSRSEANDKRRLLREAQAIALLRHENIVDVYGVALHEGTPVLIQQFVDGQSLEQRLRQEPLLELEQCIDFAKQIAKGLAAAHAAGVVHRDLKPANILLQQESQRLLIADFGLASSNPDSENSQVIAGTPAYMSPEQTLGEPIDHRSDLFSLGALLYRMVAGKLPFEHEEPQEVMRLIRTQECPSVRSVRPDVPSWLSNCIGQLMAKSPSDRIQSAQSLVDLFDSQTVKKSEPRSNSVWRKTQAVAGICVGICLLAWLGGYLYYERQAERNNETSATAESASASNIQSPAAIEQRQGVWIEGDSRQLESLAEAIEQAADGATIHLGSDIQASRLVVDGKRLTIAAAEGAKPRITCLEPEKGGAAQFLIRSRSDLTLRGLTIDWRPIEDIPVYSGGNFASMISCFLGAKLHIEDCELTSSQTGAVVGVGGQASIRNCKISGRDFAIGWMALDSVAEVTDCVLTADVGVCVAFPPIMVVTEESTRLHVSRTRFASRSAVDLAMVRVPERAIPITVEKCQFQGASVVTLTGLTNRAPVLQTAADIRMHARNLLRWKEIECEYSESNSFLDARTSRAPKRWKEAGIGSAAQWQEFWREATLEN